jgi:hypothetical protein
VTTADDDDSVPVSVRLGEVVPPEDPEDWTRPLTWVVALGMLAGPLAALVWFVVARPSTGALGTPTLVVAAALAAGAALTGATQQGAVRAWTATVGAGLFGALSIVVLGVVLAGERTVGSMPPTVAQAVMAVVGGLAGTAGAAISAAAVATRRRLLRMTVPAAIGAAIPAAIGALGIAVWIG